MDKERIIAQCKELTYAYKKGLLGQTKMPEESHPSFNKMKNETRLAYFTLPMALNYQRDSYKLWEAALKTHNDPSTAGVFETASTIDKEQLRNKLLKYSLALQPNKHINTWMQISKTIRTEFGSFEKLILESQNDFLKLREIVQKDFKKGFPYLSGPKIFNYWAFIIQEYGGARLKNSEFIEIAPDTHITQCSIKLGVITKTESEKITKEEISQKWREALKDSGITPIEMHPPLWFWSRNGFIYNLKN